MSSPTDNQAPIPTDDHAEALEDAPAFTIDVLHNDVDPDGDALALMEVSAPESGAEVVVIDDAIRYTPPVDFFGEDRISYTVADDWGATAVGHVLVQLTGVDDPPTTVPHLETVAEDSSWVAFDTRWSDLEPDGEALTYASIGPAVHGQVRGDAAFGWIVYQPPADFHGTDTIAYEVADPLGNVARGEITVVVESVPDAPVAVDDDVTVSASTATIELEVLANDTDADGDVLVVQALPDAPVKGITISPTGHTLTYTLDPSLTEDREIRYIVADPSGLTDEGLIRIEHRP